MSRNLFLLYMRKAFDCVILVDKCFSHNVLWFGHRDLSEQLKKVHFIIFLQHEGCLLKHLCSTNLSAAYEQ